MRLIVIVAALLVAGGCGGSSQQHGGAGRLRYSDFLGSWSPDGSKVVFTRDYSLTVVNADGTGLRSVAGGVAADHPVWSPTGGTIAFISASDSHSGDVMVVRPDGGGLRNLTESRDAQYITSNILAWSPDGSLIAFDGQRSEGSFADVLSVMTASGAGRRVIDRDFDVTGGIAWSPDGTQLAFISATDGDAYVVSVRGGRPRDVTRQLHASIQRVFDSPAWSPNGRWLAVRTYSANTGSPDPLYLVSADGSREPMIAPSTPGASQDPPRWLPNGRELVSDGGDGNLYLIDPGRHRMTLIARNGLFPVVSPDGTRIVFERHGALNPNFYTDTDTSQLLAVPARGGALRGLTQSG